MKHFCATIFFFFSSLTIFSQGFEWNEEINQQFKSNNPEIEISKTRSFIPSKSSLAKYIPFVHNQGETAMCVAYSLANCRTIIYAKNKRILSKNDIIKNSFSPFFLYYQSKKYNDNKCNQGLNPATAIRFLSEKGIALMADVEYPEYWPFTDKQLCNYYPPSFSTDLSNAYKYRIDEASVFSSGVSRDDKIFILKNAISSGKPIFFGMDPLPKSLQNSFDLDFWQADYNSAANDGSMGHAMIIIAYDDDKYDGAFQILNSYGRAWGNQGKIWISYNDLIEYSAIFVVLGRKYEETSFGAPLNKKIINVDNDFGKNAKPEFIKTSLKPPLSNFISD